jgi:hypothetical protein
VSELKRTPGPWRAGRMDTVSYHAGGGEAFKKVYVDDPNGEFHLGERLPATVAEVYGPLGADCRANAALVAAAPELLAACELWDQGFTNGEEFDEAQFLKWVNDNRRAARAAIAKAKGVQ